MSNIIDSDSIQEDSLEQFAGNLWAILDIEPPLDVQLIAERLGVRLEKDHLGLRVSGLAFVNCNGTRFAITNQMESPTRQRFVGLHEIAHHLFDKPCEGIILMDRSNKFSVDPVEYRADKFAAALLMPDFWVIQYWDDLKTNPDYRIEIMADRFDVSIESMKFRLRELDVHDSHYHQRV